MYNEEISKRKERTFMFILIGTMVAIVGGGIIESIRNQPERQFNNCVKKYGVDNPDSSNNLIKISCCLKIGYVPIIDVDGDFFVCKSPVSGEAISDG